MTTEKRKRLFRKNGTLYRVDPNDKNCIVELYEKKVWIPTKIAWKDFILGEYDYFTGYDFESIFSDRNYGNDQEKTDQEVNQILMDFMEWFGHDYREREIQMAIIDQLEKYQRIFPMSEGFGILVSYAERPDSYLPVCIFGFSEGLRILKTALYLSSETPKIFYDKISTILLGEIMRAKDELKRFEQQKKDQMEKREAL